MKGTSADVGGKGRSLMQLKSYGFSVPAFAILTSEFLEKIESVEFNDELLKFLNEHPLKYPLAVRSSADAEDGTENSFAGMFESVLNVQDLRSLLQAIRKVHSSQKSERVLHYGQNSGNTEFKMAIILQEMVQATQAGVLFTANPVNGHRAEMMISAVSGLGEKLVSGEESGETLRLGFQGEILENQKSEILSLEQIQKLFEAGKDVADKFVAPMDIEWAFENDELFLLQARPITTALACDSKKKFVFDNSNIQESYCGVTTPLTFSYASEAYCHVYNQLMKLMGFSQKEIEKAQWRHSHLLGYINGRVYYNINCWYEGLLYLPNFGRRKDDMEKMMGLEKPVDFVQDQEISFSEKLKRTGPMAILVARMIWKFSRIDQQVQKFDQWFWSLYNKYDRRQLQFTETDELIENLRKLQEESLQEWGIPVLNDFLVMMTYGSLKREMDRLGLGESFQNVMKGTDLVSLEPTLKLQKLAVELVQMSEADLQSEMESFIEVYGDRSMGELKLETETYRQNPKMLRNLIGQMAKASESAFGLLEKIQSHENDFDKAYRSKAGWLKASRIQKKIQKLRKAVADRELMRFHRTRIFGLMRSYYLEVGTRLKDLGCLENSKDIFYLTRNEIFEYFNGKSATSNLKALIQIRKQESEAFEQIQMPAQVSVGLPVGHWMKQIQPEAALSESSKTLQGLGCSAGVIRGVIRFVSHPSETSQLEDCILLAERTDPGWTPLFTLVKGVIIERGSALSHSAVIAREMGIPAVVGVAHVTKILKNGDEVEIDGSSGRIEIISSRNNQLESFSDHQAV